MEKFNIGSIVSKEEYTACALACNKAGDRHIEIVDGVYMVVANPPTPEPTIEEQVAALEAQTGLTRVIREIVLAENSGASEYAKDKAQEIEMMAQKLRASVEGPEAEVTDTAETPPETPEVMQTEVTFSEETEDEAPVSEQSEAPTQEANQ